MRILVDGLNLSMPRGTGIATYARNFVRQATGLGHQVDLLLGGTPPRGQQPRDVREMLAATAPGSVQSPAFLGKRLFAAARLQFDQRMNNWPVEVAWPELAIDQAWQIDDVFRNAGVIQRRFGRMTTLNIPGVDLAFWTAPIPLRVRGARNVYTIHDLVPLVDPDLVVGKAKYFKRLCKLIASTADQIVTVSECSRRDIIELLNVAPQSVTNTYQTIENTFWGDRGEAAVEVAGVTLPPRGYFLFFGAIEPKKNVARIVEAHRDSDIFMPLVIVRTPGWRSEREEAMLQSYCADGRRRCLVLDHVPRAELLALIGQARATLFPSLYEGFGLPALESIALGTPVIGATSGSLPEVVGAGGVLVNPYQIDDIRQAMRSLERDDERWADLRREGLIQARLFSPDRYRERLRALFEAL